MDAIDEEALARTARAYDAMAIDCRAMGFVDRWLVRRSLRAIYRGSGRPPPPRSRQLFVGSPLTALIVSGIATGVWWLRAHPEVHGRLIGAPVTARALAAAVRAAVRHARNQIRTVADGNITVAELASLVAVATGGTAGGPERPARMSATLHAASEQAAARATFYDRHVAHLFSFRRAQLGGVSVDHAGVIAADILRTTTPAGWRKRKDDPLDGNITRFLLATLVYTSGDRSVVRPLGALAWLAYLRRDHAVGTSRGWQRAFERIFSRAGPVFAHNEFFIVSDRPARLLLEHGRVHHEHEHAIAWRDGWAAHCLRGIVVPAAIARGDFTAAEIIEETNIEVRRLMLDVFERGDPGRFVRTAGARVIDRDVDQHGHPRRLLCVELARDEPYVAVEVTNSTAEADGSHRIYILRVPPTITSCREAVAWTFGLQEWEYAPAAES